MTAVFSNYFQEQIFSGGVTWPLTLKLVLFRYAPSLEINQDVYAQADTVAELVANVGWEEVTGIAGYPFANTIDVATTDVGNSRYVMFTEYPFTLTEPVEVQAIGVVAADPIGGVNNVLLFTTTTLNQNGYLTVRPGDTFSARLDPNVVVANNRWMIGWQIPPVTPPPGMTAVIAVEGPLAVSAGPPAFEISNTQHVWLYPQRANMIANPSFEKDTAFWGCNGAIAQVAGAAPDDPPFGATMDDNFMRPPITRVPRAPRVSSSSRAYACRFSGGTPIIVESNLFPLKFGDMPNEQWTIQLMAKGDGILKVGLVYWDYDVRFTAVDWGNLPEGGTEQWQLNPAGWTHVAVHRTAFQGYTAMVRLETDGTELVIDNVLCERLFLKDWPYFDGDSTYGSRDDFCWYGAADDTGRRGASYSLWYNNRRAVIGRLFARLVDVNDPADNVTDEQIEEMGLVYRWVPAGTTVIPHLDVFFPGDVRAPVQAKSPTDVLPYAGPDDEAPTGVLNPW
jgi:hypothetical protein